MSFRTTRRGFLAGAGAILGAAAASPAARAAVDNESAGFKLGVASYSLREFQRDLAIRMVRDLKTPYVSVKDVHLAVTGAPADWQRARREFEKGGLKIVSGGAIYFQTDDLEDTRRKFEYAKACGMPLIVAGPPRTGLAVMEKFAKEYDIKVAVHNHGPEDKNFPTPQSVLELVRDMDPRMGLCMDLGHSARAGADVVASIAQAGPRLLDIHIKDLLELGSPSARQCDVGDGAMPVPAIFRQLKKIGYTGCVNLEYEINGDNPIPGMERSFSYMRGVLAGIAG
jgi:sugar phosphate isomerase/epimerase